MKTYEHKLTGLAILLTTPALVSAHPGHGTFDGMHFMHYLTSPVHYLMLAGVIILSIFLYRKFKAVRKYN